MNRQQRRAELRAIAKGIKRLQKAGVLERKTPILKKVADRIKKLIGVNNERPIQPE